MTISEQIEAIRKARDEGHMDPETANSIIAYLREYAAPMPAEARGGGNRWWYVCGNCHTDINHRDKYCHECGKPIKIETNTAMSAGSLLNGMPPYDDPAPICPICGKECETIYTDIDGDAFGCDQCVTLWEAAEWCDEHKEEEDYVCGNCHTDINHRDKYCHECGKPIKWG